MEAVADSFRVHSAGAAAGDEPALIHDGIDSVADAIVAAAAASLVADDGMEGADDSLDHPVGSSTAAVRSNYRGCSVAVPADTADDRIAASDAVGASYLLLLRFDSGVVAAAAFAAEVADSAPGRALASVNSALPVVVPCYAADTAVVDVAADGEDSDFHCYRPRGHPRP